MPIFPIMTLQCKELDSMKISLNFFEKKGKRIRAKFHEKQYFFKEKERNRYGNMI